MPIRGNLEPDWVPIAQKFPATLAKDAAPESLVDGQTPEAYGMGLDKDGYLYADSSPSSGAAWTGIATVSAPTYAPATCTWRYAHNRLWGYVTAGGTTLYYGAPNYDSNYFIQDLGYIPVDYESSNITNVIPFGNNVAIFKSDHIYIIRNADNPGDGFVAEYLKQASGLPVAADVIVMDNTLIWANTHGVFAYNGQQIQELTLPIRNNLGAFSSATVTSLKADFQKRRIIGYTTATKFIIDIGEQVGLYDYNTSGFRFTSRTLVGQEAEPLVVDQIGLVYQYNASDYATVNIDVKINDTWKTENKFTIRPANDNGLALLPLTNVLACRKFAMRITAMSASLYINSILCHVKSGGIMGYSNK
ncbi:MAG: hypothetical protein WC554_00930 [Clostridia bacterium]|jgi:hypothetical protein